MEKKRRTEMRQAGVKKRRSRHRFSTAPLTDECGISGHGRPRSQGLNRLSEMGATDLDLRSSSPDRGNNFLHDVPELLTASASSVLHQTIGNDCDAGFDESEPNVGLVVEIPNWRVLWGILMTNGVRKITRDQYQSVRVLADTFLRLNPESWSTVSEQNSVYEPAKKNIASLSHYTTLHNVFKPALLQILAPRGRDYAAPVDVTKAGARGRFFSDLGVPQAYVRIILPREYARADVSTGPTFQAICSTSLENCKGEESDVSMPSVCSSDCIDIWPLIAARDWYYGATQSISVDFNESSEQLTDFCETGDSIKVLFLGHDALSDSLFRIFCGGQAEGGYTSLSGVVVHIWTVHHVKRQHDPNFSWGDTSRLSERDKGILDALSFIYYRSPADRVDLYLPEVPPESHLDATTDDGHRDGAASRSTGKFPGENAEAIRQHRAAVRRHSEQMDEIWRDAPKPLLKPGDVVAMLRPLATACGSTTDHAARLLVVNRFWTEHEERNRHAFWVSPDVELPPVCPAADRMDSSMTNICSLMCALSRRRYLDVVSVHLVDTHSGRRGPQKFNPVSSTGTLSNGEKYLIYRFLLFWDGFDMTTSKSASGEGFYLVCLNFPVKARSTPNAIRIISLIPPGVKIHFVFDKIKEDLVRGMTDGFLETDATGNIIRVFLDLVGFIGDTPALNSVLDVLGHNGNLCCHLCRYLRGASTLVGSRYTRPGVTSNISPFGRTFYQHIALRDCEAKKETCRLVGLKPEANVVKLPIHDLRAAFMDIRKHIPKTSTGIPILSGHLDPYRSCLIAPDHLLTGHGRDCVNLAFKLLPSKRHSEECEAFMIGFLSECRLPKQNRLVDHEKRSLYGNMSMTEMYALLLVAKLGFLMGCKKVESETGPCPLPSRCTSAIDLVGSVSSVITALWALPKAERDGNEAVNSFNSDNGLSIIIELQKKVRTHIAKVEAQCTMSDKDFGDLDDPHCDRLRRKTLAKEYKYCVLAIKTVDKPNIHRLQEFVSTTLPMVGHVSRVGELVMEKSHQSLKAAIRLSNNRDVQIQSMNSIAISDWQGRLSMVIPDAVLGDAIALRCCFRLFAGRESMFALGGRLQPENIAQVRNTIGPSCCVPQELASQSCSVLSPRALRGEEIQWKLEGEKEQVSSLACASTEERRCTTDDIRQAYCSDMTHCTVTMGHAVSCTVSLGLAGRRFRRGDVVEILCYYPTDLSYHFPCLMQPITTDALHVPDLPSAPMYWCICNICSVTGMSSSPQFLLSVLPCTPVEPPDHAHSLSIFPRYSVQKGPFPGGKHCALALLDKNIRKVGIIHDCIHCTVRQESGTIAHTENYRPLEGGTFYILSRKNGYPPRSG